MENSQVLDTRAAADFLGLKPTTLETWRVGGRGPQFLKIGRVIRYSRADLTDWLESRRRTSTSQAA